MKDWNASKVHAERLRLDDQLCFALYAATHVVTRAYRPLLKELGLTYPQYLVMLVLWQDGASRVGEIADRLGLSANAVTPLLDRLEVSGLLTRRRDEVDRRTVHVALTSSGADLEAAASLAQHQVACRTELHPDALAELRDELQALVRRMGADPEAENQPSATGPTAEDRRHGPSQVGVRRGGRKSGHRPRG